VDFVSNEDEDEFTWEDVLTAEARARGILAPYYGGVCERYPRYPFGYPVRMLDLVWGDWRNHTDELCTGSNIGWK
jgi:hypothetical protein